MRTKTLFLDKPTAFQVMIKPIGAICNLNCDYCYYLEKKNLYKGENNFTLSESILESFIKQHIAAHEVPVVQFIWQGGEPTLLGIDYYRNALKIQQKYAGSKQIENILQTNGTLLNDEWCEFLKKNNFLVGISIDGPKEIHDKYRKTKNKEGSWEKVMNAIYLLKKYHVEFNTLTVINNYNVDFPLEIYHFLKKEGSGFMQFLPVVERIAENTSEKELKLILPNSNKEARLAPWSVDPEKFGEFLITIFDEWVRNDVGKQFIQHFDVTLANWYGTMPGLCVYCETCGDATAMEFNGDLYTCDHFVFSEHYLGNIMQTPLLSLIKSEKQVQFGKDKRATLPKECIDCDYRFACNGGCPKFRFSISSDGEEGLNYLCKGYKNYFSHVHPYMQFMSDELTKKRAPANVMDWVKKLDFKKSLKGEKQIYQQTKAIPDENKKVKTERNSPCPCGSGKKFKNCCLNKSLYSF